MVAENEENEENEERNFPKTAKVLGSFLFYGGS